MTELENKRESIWMELRHRDQDCSLHCSAHQPLWL